MLPLQYSSAANVTAQLEHRSTTLSMMILGPVHASNSFHTIHHEEKYMSTMNRESWTKHQPSTSCANHAQYPCTSTMYINTISYAIRYHQWSASTICLYQSCQPCASNKCHITHDMPLPRSQSQNHVSQPSSIITSVSSMSSHTSCTKVYSKQEKSMMYFSQVLSPTNIYYLWVHQHCT